LCFWTFCVNLIFKTIFGASNATVTMNNLRGEEKNFDKENLHRPTIDRVVCVFAFECKNECNSTAVFLRTPILHTTQNQKAQFP
jgi:formate hydrogenlyase subunit 6/NADH:ubiquinone oxidoreductase subunit I